MLPLADGAVLFAVAVLFRFVAHGADDGTGHGGLQGKLYLREARAARRARGCTRRLIMGFPFATECFLSVPVGASLTLLNAHASIDFYPSHRNGISQLAYCVSNPQNAAERAASPFGGENGQFWRLGHAGGVSGDGRISG